MEHLIQQIFAISNEDEFVEFGETELAGILAGVMNEGERYQMFRGGVSWEADREVYVRACVRLYMKIGECIGRAIAQVDDEQLERVKQGEDNFNDFIDFNGIMVDVFADDENEYVNLEFYSFVQEEVYKNL